MRNLVLIGGMFALAACSGDNDTAVPDDAAEPETATVSVVGTYSGITDDGTEWTATIEEDGTSEVIVGGEVTDSSTWRTSDEGETCFTRIPDEGEEAENEECYMFGTPDENGNVVVTGASGETQTVSKIS